MAEERSFTRERPKTVGELIEALQKFPASARVMVPGAQDSLHDCGAPMMTLVMLNRYPDDTAALGPHKDASDMNVDKAVGVVLLAEANREF
ncbi:hypothetical protein [Methylosinus sp. Sm6]|uniref:hypothetical protein n=1 Tax=Methylosinus sp. Sm6 TaxID=2866948 RepID=UPI001C99856D|nr:hypothetical protein [Methylosinus sp. Sm6]MBY6242936.1 hypothetical protein [Methylosinus sp. Sm6]